MSIADLRFRPRHAAAASRPAEAPRRPRPRPPVIELARIARVYRLGDVVVPALRQVSLKVEEGEMVAIMGASGSGKSTLMNILGCLDVPTSGRSRLDGIDVGSLDEDNLSTIRNRKVGFVFQSFNLIPRTSALMNVELPLTYGGVTARERRRRAVAALELVGLGDRINHFPNELSGGQQQRVAVARAIVNEPALILADEPTGNLDSHSTREMMSIFSRLNSQGRTVVLITHELEVASWAQRIIRLKDGLVISDAAVEPQPAAS